MFKTKQKNVTLPPTRKQRRAQEAANDRGNRKLQRFLEDTKVLACRTFSIPEVVIDYQEADRMKLVRAVYGSSVYAQALGSSVEEGLVRLRAVIEAYRPPSIRMQETETGIIQTVG